MQNSLSRQIALAAAMLLPAASHADAPLRQDAARQAEQLQKQEQERLRAASQNSLPSPSVLPLSQPPAADSSQSGGPCRQIDRIDVSGNTLLAPRRIAPILSGFEGRCLNARDIEQLLGELTRLYLQDGWVASRVYLPAQDLTRGRLKIAAAEGRVETIAIRDGKQNNSVYPANVFPGATGRPLNLRDLEQGIEQINRVPGNQATLDIQPGEHAGGSLVVVNNQLGSRWNGNLSWDNQGSRSTGQEQAGAAVSAGNVLGLNETWSLNHRQNLQTDNGNRLSRSDTVSLAIPFGYTLLSLADSRSSYASLLNTPGGQSLKLSGDSRNDSLRLDRAFYRDQLQTWQLSANLTRKDASNYLADQLLQVSSRTLSVLDLESGWNRSIGPGSLDLRLAYSRGLNALGAIRDLPDLGQDDPRAQFGKYTLNATVNLPFRLFGLDASWLAQFSGQKADCALYGSEQISIGGLYSVRGFRDNSLSGDNGFYLRNTVTVRKPLQVAGKTVSLRLYAGLDGGHVNSRAAGAPSGSLAGGIVGMGLQYGPLSWDLSHADTISLPGQMQREGGQTWASVNLSF